MEEVTHYHHFNFLVLRKRNFLLWRKGRICCVGEGHLSLVIWRTVARNQFERMIMWIIAISSYVMPFPRLFFLPVQSKQRLDLSFLKNTFSSHPAARNIFSNFLLSKEVSLKASWEQLKSSPLCYVSAVQRFLSHTTSISVTQSFLLPLIPPPRPAFVFCYPQIFPRVRVYLLSSQQS